MRDFDRSFWLLLQSPAGRTGYLEVISSHLFLPTPGNNHPRPHFEGQDIQGNSHFPAGTFRCGGEYLHVSERINGQPVWKQRGSQCRTLRDERLEQSQEVIKAKGIGLGPFLSDL